MASRSGFGSVPLPNVGATPTLAPKTKRGVLMSNYPKSANDMIYNFEEHMYVLTADYVKNKTGVDLILHINDMYVTDKTTAVNRILEKISLQIYSFVYSFNSRYNDYQEYLMAKSQKAREILRRAMLLQLEYVMRNGKINELVGINMSFTQSNAAFKAEDFRGERAIHPEAVQELKKPLENGEKLLNNGNYYIPSGIKFKEGY